MIWRAYLDANGTFAPDHARTVLAGLLLPSTQRTGRAALRPLVHSIAPHAPWPLRPTLLRFRCVQAWYLSQAAQPSSRLSVSAEFEPFVPAAADVIEALGQANGPAEWTGMRHALEGSDAPDLQALRAVDRWMVMLSPDLTMAMDEAVALTWTRFARVVASLATDADGVPLAAVGPFVAEADGARLDTFGAHATAARDRLDDVLGARTPAGDLPQPIAYVHLTQRAASSGVPIVDESYVHEVFATPPRGAFAVHHVGAAQRGGTSGEHPLTVLAAWCAAQIYSALPSLRFDTSLDDALHALGPVPSLACPGRDTTLPTLASPGAASEAVAESRSGEATSRAVRAPLPASLPRWAREQALRWVAFHGESR